MDRPAHRLPLYTLNSAGLLFGFAGHAREYIARRPSSPGLEHIAADALWTSILLTGSYCVTRAYHGRSLNGAPHLFLSVTLASGIGAMAAEYLMET